MKNDRLDIYKTLRAHYGDLHWWPAETPYEVMVGAVLTQNTAWSNVEKAIANFSGTLSPKTVLNMDMPELTGMVKSRSTTHIISNRA